MVHTWCSGSTTAFQAAGPSSILGVCIICHTRIVNSLYFIVLNLYEPAQGWLHPNFLILGGTLRLHSPSTCVNNYFLPKKEYHGFKQTNYTTGTQKIVHFATIHVFRKKLKKFWGTLYIGSRQRIDGYFMKMDVFYNNRPKMEDLLTEFSILANGVPKFSNSTKEHKVYIRGEGVGWSLVSSSLVRT